MLGMGLYAIVALCLVGCATASPTSQTNAALQTNLQLKNMLLRHTSADDVREIATDMLEAHKELSEINDVVHKALIGLGEGAELLHNGICNFIGFCRTNPALSCDEIAHQHGVTGSELPSGKYWLQASPESLGSKAALPPARIECYFDERGNGWTLLIDDSHSPSIKQRPVDPIMSFFRFRQVLASTPKMLEENISPTAQAIYYVDESRLETAPGKTLDEIHNNMWAGQDGWGVQNDKGKLFPNSQVHNRWKYFGKVQPNSFKSTLYIMDDGNILEDACRSQVDASKCGQDFYCDNVNGAKVIRRYSQTSIPDTANGVISFGCSDDPSQFTMCGSCTYEGPSNHQDVADKVQSSVVQKMFVR